MIIKLPRNFYYTTNETNYAYVSNGILYIHGKIAFENLMYNLTYSLLGYKRCKYCGKILLPSERTLDHIYPRSWGGVSIPNNLIPCCQECNQSKADMTPTQFNRWRKLETEIERKQFYKKCHKENSKYIAKGKFILPREWLTKYDTTELIEEINFGCLQKFKIEKVKEYYEKNHQYNHPIIVSSDGWLLKGLHILYYAKQINDLIVPAIVLENVVVIRKDAP